MVRGRQFIAIVDKVSSKSTTDEKGKRAGLRTREATDFDPKSRVLCSQKEVIEYLAMYHVRLASNIEVEWCPPETDVTMSLLSVAYIFTPRSRL